MDSFLGGLVVITTSAFNLVSFPSCLARGCVPQSLSCHLGERKQNLLWVRNKAGCREKLSVEQIPFILFHSYTTQETSLRLEISKERCLPKD